MQSNDDFVEQSAMFQNRIKPNILSEDTKDCPREVCGFAFPVPGTAGIAVARSLRQSLMIARDEHPELKYRPEAQVLVDKIIRHLSNISPEGLSAQVDIPLLSTWAYQINSFLVEKEIAAIEESVLEAADLNSEEEEFFEALEAKKHSDMFIQSDDCISSVKIDLLVNKNTGVPVPVISKRKIHHKPLKSKKQTFVEVETRVAAPKIEKNRLDDSGVSDSISDIPTEESATTESSLVHLYLKDGHYSSFIRSYYNSSAAFEKILRTVVANFEAKTVDPFERWLGEETVSPFSFMQNLTVQEILELAAHKDVRLVLHQENVKYETFVAWVDMIDEMQMLVSEDMEISFGELFAKWLIESDMRYVSSE